MVFGVFRLELRAVIMVETGVVVDNGCTRFWERREDACCKPRDGGGDFGDCGGHTAHGVVLAIVLSQ